jgi:hypothetical protein
MVKLRAAQVIIMSSATWTSHCTDHSPPAIADAVITNATTGPQLITIIGLRFVGQGGIGWGTQSGGMARAWRERAV